MKKIDHIKYHSLDEFKKKSFFRQNILKWYPFDKNSTFLHINGEDGILSKYLSTFGKVFYLSDNLLDLEGLQKFCPGVKIINESVNRYLTKSDLNSYNDYNTRNTSFIGLPVGPICNMGIKSIEAALKPSDTNYLYFYADIKTGKLYFAENMTEFQKLIETYR